MYWFHASQYGSHAGIVRTRKRMKQWVWWPNLDKDVAAFVDSCLVCHRFANAPTMRTALGVLAKPLPLELIAIDFMGPYSFKERNLYVVVVIDHCSRYMLCRWCDAPTSERACQFLKDCWVAVLGYPSVVLSDQGSCFKSAYYNEFVTTKLGARVIHSSIYYPQGNAINETCHRLITKAICAGLSGQDPPQLPDLSDVSLVYNAVPAYATGVSPYFFLFGFEPVFPGWQAFRLEVDEDTRIIRRQEARFRQIAGIAIAAYERGQQPSTPPAVGSWIVYWLSKYEQQQARDTLGPTAIPFAWGPSWSLPAKVIEVHDKIVVVQELGVTGRQRQVPISQIRQLPPHLPETLQQVNLQLIESTAPRRLVEALRTPLYGPTPLTTISMDELVDKAFKNRKRPRTLFQPVIVRPQLASSTSSTSVLERDVEVAEE